MGHVLFGNRCMPNISCFLALPMYWPVLNLRMFVFCASVIVGLFQKLLDVSFSMVGFIVHLWMLGKSLASVSKLFYGRIS